MRMLRSLKQRSEKIDFRFSDFSEKQLKVLLWWCKASPVRDRLSIIADGSIRSGKTLSMSLSFVLWSMETFNGCSFAMCGKTIGSFRRNVLDTLKRMLIGLGYRVQDSRAENVVYVCSGNRINKYYIFGGRDERSQDLIQGMTLAGVLFDEVALMPQSFVQQAMARCSVEDSRFWFNCNPENPEHWFYKEWIAPEDEKKRDKIFYQHFTMEDNLTISAEKRAEYESLYRGVFYDRFILGKWVKAEGVIYPMFNREYHVVPQEDRPYDQYYISCDYGTLNPMSMGLWGRVSAHLDNEGNRVPERWYRIREYYWDGRKQNRQLTDEEYYLALEELAGGRRIEDVIVDPSAASFITCIRRHDRYSVKKADNDVVNGIRQVATYLQCGRIFFNDCCKDAIREFGLYVWDEKSGKDAPLKENDHAMDDIRYFVHTVMKRSDDIISLEGR